MNQIYKTALLLIVLSGCNPYHFSERKVKKAIKSDSYSTNNDTLFNTALKRHHYTYMFEPSEDTLHIGENTFGKYVGGFKGIGLYSGLHFAVSQHVKNRDSIQGNLYGSFYDITSYNKLLPEPLFLEDYNRAKTFGSIKNGVQGFGKYNSKMVAYLAKNFIPAPNDSITHTSNQVLYSVIFEQFARVLTGSYLYIEKKGFKEETAAYSAIFNTKKNGFTYLKETYKDVVLSEPFTFSFSEMTPQIAIGFWLRRDIDGSKKEFWKGLSKVMYLYDKEWFLKKTKKST